MVYSFLNLIFFQFILVYGYRVYCCQQGHRVIILLEGGNKTSQSKDIKLALKLAKDVEEEL